MRRALSFPQPLVSILTPVFDTPVSWLREAVDSVLAQTYENWELLLIDDGSTATDLLRALPGFAARDRRIRLVALESHQGISAALNRGLDLAEGQWLTFLDHDDVLEADALFQNVKLLQEKPGLDLIYSDEDKLTDQGFDSPILKPDWSPDFFLSCNYLCHLIFLRRDLVREVGEFRREFDGSQDYDLLLRVSERTNRIHHIPRVLYHWRRSENSSASDVRQKPGQLEASWRAIEAHLQRRGEAAHVAVDWRTHAFSVRRQLFEPRKISVIIPSSHGPESLRRFVENLISKTGYPNCDIVIVQVGERDKACEAGADFRVLHFADAANASAAKNYVVQQTDSPWLLFLDDSVEPIETDWLTIMAEHVQRPEVGAVGARLVESQRYDRARRYYSWHQRNCAVGFLRFPGGRSGCEPSVAHDAQLQRGFRRVFVDAAGSFFGGRRVRQKPAGIASRCGSLPKNASSRLSGCLHTARETLLGSVATRSGRC